MNTALLEMVLPFCIACDFLKCGPELVHTHMYRVFGWWVEMGWDGFDPHRPVFGWWVVWVGLVPEEEYTP